MTNPLSKGFQTSEFAATVSGVLVSLLVTFGVIQAADAKTLTNLLATVIAGAVALISIWGMVAQYVQGRNQIKQTMLEKNITAVKTQENSVKTDAEATTPSL
jgi:hypothetical protein